MRGRGVTLYTISEVAAQIAGYLAVALLALILALGTNGIIFGAFDCIPAQEPFAGPFLEFDFEPDLQFAPQVSIPAKPGPTHVTQ